jgi:hypothetical protein
MNLFANPFIKSMMIFFVITMGFDLASRTILNPKWKKQTPKIPKTESVPEEIGEEGEVDQTYEESVIANGAMINDPSETYILTAEFCECCGLRKQYEILKEKLEQYKNVMLDERVVGKPAKKKLVQGFFQILQFILIALAFCKILFLFNL